MKKVSFNIDRDVRPWLHLGGEGGKSPPKQLFTKELKKEKGKEKKSMGGEQHEGWGARNLLSFLDGGDWGRMFVEKR